MRHMLNELVCQLLHGRWARVTSYSRQGAWECTKHGCRAQARRAAQPGQPAQPAVPAPPDHQRIAA
jgi:hypothetical protein